MEPKLLSALRFISFIAFVLLFAVLPPAQALQGERTLPEEFGGEFGYLLPSGVPGVKDILTFWGVHYATTMGPGLIDLGALTGNSRGSNYSIFSAGYRLEFPFDIFLTHVGLGATLHNYTQRDRRDFTSVLGGYLQVGAMYGLTNSLYLGSNFRFFISPGAGLYVGLGATYMF